MSSLHNFKECLDIIIVFFLGSTRHSDVVKVEECVFQLPLLDDFVHKSMKDRNTIGHTKWYATELVQLSTRSKCSIFPLYLRYRNLMIGIFEIIMSKTLYIGQVCLIMVSIRGSGNASSSD